MDRIINVKVFGNHMTKDNNKAGTRGEANATTLRITFDDGWYDFEKEVIFWDAYGQNPVKGIITIDQLGDAAKSTSVYLVPIPPEAMARAGMLTFSIRGTLNEVRQVAITGTLEVDDSPDVIEEPIEIKKDDLTRMQEQLEGIKTGIQGMAEAKAALEEIKSGAETYKDQANDYASNAQDYSLDAKGYMDDAPDYAERAEAAVGKTSYIGDNGNWYAWDGENSKFYDTGVKAQAGSEVYVGKHPPAEADVWIDPDGDEADITTEMIVNGAVTTTKLADNAVTAEKIDDEAILLQHLGTEVLEKINSNKKSTELILCSSTEGSNKEFVLTINDEGTINVREIN